MLLQQQLASLNASATAAAAFTHIHHEELQW
jgi:hypothetical protein